MNALQFKKIVFLGTPDFAAIILEGLIKLGLNIVAVITAPDKPAGRGLKLQPSAVKKIALQHQIPLLQPTNLKDIYFLDSLKLFDADLQVVVAFRMLPQQVWDMPPEGTINLHASLLPNYRGAAPIHWAVINGETETGLTTFKLKHVIDSGDIIDQYKIPILLKDTMATVYNKMLAVGAALLFESIHKIFSQQCIFKSQDELIQDVNSLKLAPKIKNEDVYINWQQPVQKVYNFIRGLNNFPGAVGVCELGAIKFYEVQFETVEHHKIIGTVTLNSQTNKPNIFCQDGYIEVYSWQLPGKSKMAVEDYLKGNKLPERFYEPPPYIRK
ncbi:MAG: methionyl-tRNA formyltransferase [Alphaproteobacteria bacterium]|nr:methionyl-tRNA formyltransferase [Alphaproteobacteria bacterium]